MKKFKKEWILKMHKKVTLVDNCLRSMMAQMGLEIRLCCI